MPKLRNKDQVVKRYGKAVDHVTQAFYKSYGGVPRYVVTAILHGFHIPIPEPGTVRLVEEEQVIPVALSVSMMSSDKTICRRVAELDRGLADAVRAYASSRSKHAPKVLYQLQAAQAELAAIIGDCRAAYPDFFDE